MNISQVLTIIELLSMIKDSLTGFDGKRLPKIRNIGFPMMRDGIWYLSDSAQSLKKWKFEDSDLFNDVVRRAKNSNSYLDNKEFDIDKYHSDLKELNDFIMGIGGASESVFQETSFITQEIEDYFFIDDSINQLRDSIDRIKSIKIYDDDIQYQISQIIIDLIPIFEGRDFDRDLYQNSKYGRFMKYPINMIRSLIRI